ncbi:MAG: hypothetical protein Q4D36_00485 [Bacteroidales bacterium]|nr:hypothetical protein [Bacteroidales bacterium]
MDTDHRSALLAVVEVAEGECTCGCADAKKECLCATQKPCCCCGSDVAPEAATDEGHDSDAPCSKVRIEKLNVPTLTASLHLEQVTLMVTDLSFYHHIINTELLSAAHEEKSYPDTSMHRLRSSQYLHLMCTLLI